MEKITKKLMVGVVKEKAFEKFVNGLNKWWPKEYTWSQDKLKEIKIDGREGGLCTEIGPHGFRCDWGRVTGLTEYEQIELKWQISPNRVPVPNPENASDIRIKFKDDGESETTLEFEHFNFENHREGAEEYRKMMNGKQGWDYILNCFKEYCEK